MGLTWTTYSFLIREYDMEKEVANILYKGWTLYVTTHYKRIVIT